MNDKFGEPWTFDDGSETFLGADGFCAFDFPVPGNAKTLRIMECVNALAGVANPAAVKELVEAVKHAASKHCGCKAGLWVDEERNYPSTRCIYHAALAALDAGAKEGEHGP